MSGRWSTFNDIGMFTYLAKMGTSRVILHIIFGVCYHTKNEKETQQRSIDIHDSFTLG